MPVQASLAVGFGLGPVPVYLAVFFGPWAVPASPAQLWAPQLVSACLAVVVDLGSGATASLSGCGFRSRGQRWPLRLWLLAPVLVSLAVFLGPKAGVGLSACDFRP